MNFNIINNKGNITELYKNNSDSIYNYKILTTIYNSDLDNKNKYQNNNDKSIIIKRIGTESKIIKNTYIYNNIYDINYYDINFHNSFLIILNYEPLLNLLYNNDIFIYNDIKDIKNYIKKLYNRINKKMSINNIIKEMDINNKLNTKFIKNINNKSLNLIKNNDDNNDLLIISILIFIIIIYIIILILYNMKIIILKHLMNIIFIIFQI
jgi:hypothetical protein